MVPPPTLATRCGRIALSLVLIAAIGACRPGNGDNGAVLHADSVGGGGRGESLMREAAADATGQGLVQFDETGKTVPGIATSWRVADDGLSVIFRLRSAKWSDGRPVTADQVVSAFRRLLGPTSRNQLKPLFGRIVNAPQVMTGRLPPKSLGISAPVGNVVEIRLSAPTPELLQLLAQPDASILRSGRDAPVNGPFVSDDSDGSASLAKQRFKRNHDYYAADSVKLAGLHLTATGDPTVAVARFTRDAADIVIGGDIGSLGEVRTLTKAALLHVEPVWGVYGYVANVRSGPLADVRVRTALAMAIDRNTLVRQLFTADDVPPVAGLLPASLVTAPAQPSWIQLPVNERLAIARALLAAAGYDAGHPLTLTVRLPVGRGHAVVAAAVATDWQAIGVVTNTRVETADLHARALARNDFELALVERASLVDTPWSLLDKLSCGAHVGGYCNTDADALVARALAEQDPVARLLSLHRAQELMMIDMPMIALFSPVRWSLVSAQVGGWVDNPGGRHPLARLTKTPRRRLIN